MYNLYNILFCNVSTENMLCGSYREDAEKARGGVKKVNGRPVQIVFADKRALKQDRKPRMSKGEGEGEKELTRDVELADGAME